eukprot:COSAG01_NODE_1859_length_9042_cov_9.585374_1_plen_161_part_00
MHALGVSKLFSPLLPVRHSLSLQATAILQHRMAAGCPSSKLLSSLPIDRRLLLLLVLLAAWLKTAISHVEFATAAADRGPGRRPYGLLSWPMCTPAPAVCDMEALPAGDESRAGKRCYFCDRCAQETKGSKRGMKRVWFHRCCRTQPCRTRGPLPPARGE